MLNLSDILISHGIASPAAIQAAGERFPDRRIDQALVHSGQATEESVLQTLADSFTWDKIATQTVNFFTSLPKNQ